MKKVNLILMVMFVSVFSSHAQHFKKLKLGVGSCYSVPFGSNPNKGAIIYFEPAYRIDDRFTVGLRFETTMETRGTHGIMTINGEEITGRNNFQGTWSLSVNGQYYFGEGAFRPFVGLGLGFYLTPSAGSTVISTTNNGLTYYHHESITSSQIVGVYPRIGFDAGHFSFNLEFNVGPKYWYENSFVTLTPDPNDSWGFSEKGGRGMTYLGVKFGFFIGGGRTINEKS